MGLTVAMAVLVLLHAPPVVASVSVVVADTHTADAPPMAATCGRALLRRMEILFAVWLPAAMSGLPSPSRSPMATPNGLVPVA